MKKSLLPWLICPACLPNERPLQEKIDRLDGEDILEGTLTCPACDAAYPIQEGIAALIPPSPHPVPAAPNKYETPAVVSSYLWSHYGDLLNEEMASDAYQKWAELVTPHEGISLDAGCAVGRFTLEMSQKCDFVVGLDNSRAFISTARELRRRRSLVFSVKEEGYIQREVRLDLPAEWDTEKVEFIVGDALALPFPAGSFSSFASLNLVDKVPSPLKSLEEMNRVTRPSAPNSFFPILFPGPKRRRRKRSGWGGNGMGRSAAGPWITSWRF